MDTDRDRSTDVRVLAFYLPQYHPITENNEWWGTGFTEWTQVSRAKPLYRGHQQPKLPKDLGFYDLRLSDSREEQARLARAAGVDGFVYWHYWFGNGRRILERPFQEVVEGGQPDFPFALGWANESWSRRWYGDTRTILMEQKYPGVDDYVQHFEALLPAFKDPRYITVDGKPLFFVYRPQDLPSASEFVETFQRLAKAAGFGGLYLIAGTADDPRAAGFDASYAQPSLTSTRVIRRRPRTLITAAMRKVFEKGGPLRLDYQDVMNEFNSRGDVEWVEFEGVMPNWDNTPRRMRGGIVLTRSSPDAFERQLRVAMARAKPTSGGERMVFLKSWNEWAEGNFVEPDQEDGTAWIEAIERATKR